MRKKLGQRNDPIGNTNIYVGTKADSRLRSDPAWAVVNTAKSVRVETKGWNNAPPRGHRDIEGAVRDQHARLNAEVLGQVQLH